MFWLYFLPGLFATQPPAGTCVTAPSFDFFVWVEWPWIHDVPPANDFYDQLLSFTKQNCIGARVTRLVLRVLHPEFPSPSTSLWWPPAASPMYTHLISKLPPGVELVLYPYVKDEDAGNAWMRFGNSSNPIEGAWVFMSQWDAYLASQGAGSKFVGTAIDHEEVSGMQRYSPIVFDSALAQGLKAKFGQALEFGVATGFDGVGKIQAGFDKVYVELYDFYSPKAYAAQDAVSSPFLIHRGDPAGMADYILKEALTPYQLEEYGKHPSVVMAMWSSQNLNGLCIHPDDNMNICGINYELGSWGPDAFNSFINQIRSVSPVMASLSHGIFQFSYTPKSWMS